MASRISRRLYHATKGRFYSARPAVKEGSIQNALLNQAEVTNLENGLKVVSVENFSPVTRLALVAKAGPRYETREEAGITHCLRHAAGLSNRQSSGFKMTRSTARTGADICVTSTREYLQYGTACTRNNCASLFNTIADIVKSPYFKPWEFSTLENKMNLDIALQQQNPVSMMIELLHEAAFRDTLGRSLYASKCQIGQFTSGQVEKFMRNFLTSGRMALVGLGIEHEELMTYAESFQPYPETGDATEAAKYQGGELRERTTGDITYAAVVTEGPSLTSKDVLSAGVLQMIMGAGPHVKYSESGSASKLSEALKKSASGPFSVSGINFNYTDSGLFGFMMAGQCDDMEKLLKAAVEQYRNITKVGVTEADITRGKNQLKAQIAMQLEDGDNVFQNLVEQAMASSNIVTQDNVMQMVDKVTIDDVTAVAKRLINGKASMASVGDLRTTPYIDQLFK